MSQAFSKIISYNARRSAQMNEALETIEKQGYLLRLENTDAWFIAHHRPPKSLLEALDAQEIAWDNAYELIEAGLVKERLQYSLDSGTLIWVYTLVGQAKQAQAAAGSE
jgi:hypothetical protein